MPKIDIDNVPAKTGSAYPGKMGAEMAGRSSLQLGDAGGLSQFGANLVKLAPGAKSSIIHWHTQQDEFLMVTEGELTLVEDDGEALLRVGDCAAFPAGHAVGHQIVNRSNRAGAFLVVGTRTEHEVAYYTDRDMMMTSQNSNLEFTRKDGTPIDDGDSK